MLTNRERDVLALAGRGLSNQDIATELGISSRTVKCILHHACVKLKTHNRAQALFTALSQGDINIQEILSLDELVELFTSLKPEVINTIAQRLRLRFGQRLHPSEMKYIPNLAEARLLRTATKSSLLACDSAQRPRKGLGRNSIQNHPISQGIASTHYRKVLARK